MTFSLCLRNVRVIIIIDGKIKYDVSKTHSHNGTKRNELNAEKDDFLYMIAISSHIKHVKIPVLIEKTRIMPSRVATPLPPLNFCHKGNKWPKNTITAEQEVENMS